MEVVAPNRIVKLPLISEIEINLSFVNIAALLLALGWVDKYLNCRI